MVNGSLNLHAWCENQCSLLSHIKDTVLLQYMSDVWVQKSTIKSKEACWSSKVVFPQKSLFW